MNCTRLLLLTFVFSIAITTSAHGMTFNPFVQFTLRDSVPVDGIADHLRPSDDSGYIGQVTGPSPMGFEEETFLEFDLQSVGTPTKSILHLNFFYSDYANGTGKKVSLSTYGGDGIPALSLFGTGSLLDTYLLPSFPNPGQQYSLDVDVTSVVQALVMNNAEFLGIRLHDAMFNDGSPGLGIDSAQVALGNGSGLLAQTLEAVPEPFACAYLSTMAIFLTAHCRGAFLAGRR